MSEMSDTSKKVVAGTLAGTLAVTGGVAATHRLNKNEPEYLEPTTTLSKEYNGQMPTGNEYTIAGKTYIVQDPSTSIFGEVTEINQESLSDNLESTSEYHLSEDRIVLASKFNDLNELYNHYMNVWKEKSAGRTPLEIIQNVDNEEIASDNDLKVAASLVFLAKGNTNETKNVIQALLIAKNKDIGTIYEENKDYMKLIQLLVLPGNYGEHLDQNIMADLEFFWNQFPEEFKTDYNYKRAVSCFVLLANEFTALVDVKTNGKAAVTYNGAYLTIELADLATKYNIRLHGGVLVCLAQLDKDIPRGLKR